MKKYLVLGAVAVFAVMAAGSTASAAMGVGVSWGRDGATPDFVLPIKTASGLVLEPFAGFRSVTIDTGSVGGPSVTDFHEGTGFRFGLNVEKDMDAVGGATPFFGAMGMAEIFSPEGNADSWTDVTFGVFVGGTAAIGDNVDIVGYWGPEVVLVGKRIKDGETATIVQSSAHLMVRWWLWGM